MKEITGDLIELALAGEFSVIAHGCNCQKMMGAGIAGQISRKLSFAHMADCDDPRTALARLGDFSVGHKIIETESKMFSLAVVNLYTQYNGGKNLNMSALDLSLYKLSLIVPKEANLGLPQIGCGIAGGDWSKVKLLIIKHLGNHNVTIVHYKPEEKVF